MLRNFVNRSNVKHGRLPLHVPDVEDVGRTFLCSLVPLVPCQIELQRRDAGGFNFDHTVLKAELAVIVRQDIIASVVVIKAWPLWFFMDAD